MGMTRRRILIASSCLALALSCDGADRRPETRQISHDVGVQAIRRDAAVRQKPLVEGAALDAGAKQTKKVKPKRIGVIGDSISTPTKRVRGLYPIMLEKILKKADREASVTAYGMPGRTIVQIRNKFQAEMLGKGYDTVIIQGGVNMIAYTVDFEKARQAFSDMVASAYSGGISNVLVLTVVPWAGYDGMRTEDKKRYRQKGLARTRDLNRWLLDREKGLRSLFPKAIVVDTSVLGDGLEFPAIKEGFDRGDGIHLSEGGNMRLAKLIEESISAIRNEGGK
ncbi:MAG: SGNH/GDSL hydrolase family protein [Candidatus Micrarchaeota archaeon]